MRMPRDDYGDDDDALDDDEAPGVSDIDTDAGDELAEAEDCPYCGKSVYENADRCPHCGSFISFEDAPRHPKAWIIVGVVVCVMLVLIVWVVLRYFEA